VARREVDFGISNSFHHLPAFASTDQVSTAENRIILISALFVPLFERMVFGGVISAMTYEMGLIPIAGATATIGAVTAVAILIEHWIAALLFRKL